MENNTLCNRHSLGVNNHTKMYVTYTRIYGWSDYGGESSYQPGYRLENMMWMTLLVYDYIIPGENYIWWQISFKYNLLYVNKIIYITEYLDGGLTKSGRKLRISCPLGGMENSKMGFNRKFPLRERIKRGILYNCYAFFAGYSMKKRLEKSNDFRALVEITYLPGWMLYLKWKKYLE